MRKLLREIELRNDIRAAAIFSLMLYSGCRVGDLVELDLHDLMISERSGSVYFPLWEGEQATGLPLASARSASHCCLPGNPPTG